MRIALYQGKSLISRLIRWQTRSKYSHAALLCDDGSVIEAWASPWPGKVRTVVPDEPGSPDADISGLSKQHTPGTRVDIFNFVCPLTPDENARIYFFARRFEGRPYAYLSIARFLTRERSSDKYAFFCSELVFLCCSMAGRSLLDRTEAWRVPPDWIARSPHLTLSKTITTIQA